MPAQMRVSLIQRPFDPLGVDDAAAAAYGQLAAAVVGAGRSPRPHCFDLLIAATARAHGARLYTKNLEDIVGTGDLVEVVAV